MDTVLKKLVILIFMIDMYFMDRKTIRKNYTNAIIATCTFDEGPYITLGHECTTQ